jgi:hypothetical protein
MQPLPSQLKVFVKGWIIPNCILQAFMPFASDLPNNNFAAYEAEKVMWKCKWQNVTEKPITLIDIAC